MCEYRNILRFGGNKKKRLVVCFILQSHMSPSQDSAPSFPKSAQDRMMSFVERKTKLIEEARRRYMEKHGLLEKQS